ncbi:hypothetical protein J6590_040393 [Homalodisca vitripennis]|nr:hypothetical protein J6590_040393 [Homalodisca vitripennis]
MINDEISEMFRYYLNNEKNRLITIIHARLCDLTLNYCEGQGRGNRQTVVPTEGREANERVTWSCLAAENNFVVMVKYHDSPNIKLCPLSSFYLCHGNPIRAYIMHWG